MIFPDASLLDENPEWRTVLTAYREIEITVAGQREADHHEANKELRKRKREFDQSDSAASSDPEPAASSEGPEQVKVIREAHWTPRITTVNDVQHRTAAESGIHCPIALNAGNDAMFGKLNFGHGP